MKNLLRLALLALVSALVLPVQAQDKVIRIGVLMPISGPGSYFGVMGKEGIDLALEQLKGGVNGYKLQVQYEDSACSPLQATNTVKRVLEQLKPHIVIGEECSDASLAIAPILEQAKVVQLNAGSVTMKLTESGYKYVFRIFPNAEQQSLPLVKVAREKLKAQTAVVLFEKTNAGIDNAEGFATLFEKNGGKVTYVIYSDEGHGFARPENSIDFNARAENFLSQCLGGRAETISGEKYPGSTATVRVVGAK